MVFGKPSRRMWITAIGLSLLCVAAFAYALITSWNVEPDTHRPPGQAARGGGGFGIGLIVGVGAGVVLGGLLASRKNS